MYAYHEDILEAIHLAYEDDPTFEAECYAYLCNLTNTQTAEMGYAAGQRLAKMGRCERCGSALEVTHGKEWHSEVQDWESYVEYYCPCCDIDTEGARYLG